MEKPSPRALSRLGAVSKSSWKHGKEVMIGAR